MDVQPQFSMTPCSTSDRLILGVDYGTTGTAISVVLVDGRTGNIRIPDISPWPTSPEKAKVPSRIAYARSNPSFSMRSPCWGFGIEPDMIACSWTKLLLDQNVELAEFDDEVLKAVASLGIFHPASWKSPVEVITDYLEHVLAFLWDKVLLRWDIPLDRLFVDLRFTIPATWSEKSQGLSRQAVTLAWRQKRPQDVLTLMSEPEAAAEAVYKLLQPELKVGDGMLICDCGGGTVDIATYLVTDWSGFNLCGIMAIQGGKCGGMAINNRLYAIIAQRLPTEFRSRNYLIAPGSDFISEFERMKQEFGEANPRATFKLPLNFRGHGTCTLRDFDFQNKYLILSKEDIRQLFDPVISKITNLIKSQIMAVQRECGSPVINRIVLVGGLAASPYVQEKLRQSFEEPGRMTVTVPPNPMLAVATGAALRGLREDFLIPWTSPQHYGFETSRPLSYGLDLKYMVMFDGLGMPIPTTRRASWVITEGQQYQQGHTHLQNLSGFYWEGDPRKMTIPVYACRSMPRPPDTIDHDSVILAGLIAADFSTLDLTSLDHKVVHRGRTVYRLRYQIRTIVDAHNRTLHFTAEALGQTIGTFSLPIR